MFRPFHLTPTAVAWPLPIRSTPMQVAVLVCASLMVVSMIYSPFMISISIWGFVGCAIVYQRSVAPEGTSFGQTLWRMTRHYIQGRAYLLFSLLFLLPALSGLWSTDVIYWAERTRVRLPFLVLPWAFVNLPPLQRAHYRLVLYVLIGVLVITCIGVGINFLLHFSEVIDGLQNGKSVPVPRDNHIRFSLMVALGAFAGGKLFLEGFVLRYHWERWALGVGVLFLFAFLHVLSVRSGLVAMYVGLVFTIGRFLWRTRQWGIGLVGLFILMLVPIVAFKTLPSLQERISYMLWDWQQYNTNLGVNYSDAARFVSLETGVLAWRAHPWLGTGAGDLRTEIATLTALYFPAYRSEPKLPHNQWIYFLAATGLIGLLVSALALYYPLWEDRYRRYYLFAVLQVIIAISFLVEYTIETSIGVLFCLFYTLWFMKMAEAGIGEKT